MMLHTMNVTTMFQSLHLMVNGSKVVGTTESNSKKWLSCSSGSDPIDCDCRDEHKHMSLWCKSVCGLSSSRDLDLNIHENTSLYLGGKWYLALPVRYCGGKEKLPSNAQVSEGQRAATRKVDGISRGLFLVRAAMHCMSITRLHSLRPHQ